MSSPTAMTARARATAQPVASGRLVAKPTAVRACSPTSTWGSSAPAEATIRPPTTPMAMNRTDSGWLKTASAALITAPWSVESSMNSPATLSPRTTSPRKPATASSIHPNRTSATRRRGASQMPSPTSTRATRGTTQASVDTAWMTGMIWLAMPSWPPTSASVRFRFSGMMSAACGTNFSRAVVAVAPRSASLRTAESLPCSVIASWNERMAGVNTPSSSGLPATAAAPAAIAGSTAMRSGCASSAANATA